MAASVGAAASAAVSASAMSSSIPGSCLSAVSVWNRPTARSACPDERRRRRLEDRGQALESPGGRCQTSGQRGELASVERVEAVADDVDPRQRVPSVFTQLGLGKTGGLQLADQQVSIDGLVGRQPGRRSELGEPSVDVVQQRGSAGRRQVGPAIVVVMLAGRGGKVGLSRKVSARNASMRVEKSDMG